MQEKDMQDWIDWLFLTHCVEYDNHPLIRVIDSLIIVLGYVIDFVASIGNNFIERKLKKKYMRKRKWEKYMIKEKQNLSKN